MNIIKEQRETPLLSREPTVHPDAPPFLGK